MKQKSVKAANLLQSWWSPGSSTMQRKSRRAARLLMGVGALCFSFRVRCERRKIPYRLSIALRLVWVGKCKNAPSSCSAFFHFTSPPLRALIIMHIKAPLLLRLESPTSDRVVLRYKELPTEDQGYSQDADSRSNSELLPVNLNTVRAYSLWP